MNLDQFFDGYVTCALWSSVDDDGTPMDDAYGVENISTATRESMRDDCARFIAENAADLAEYRARRIDGRWTGAELAGHDFWLTRNGHGAGFWDRGLGDLGDRLSAAAQAFGPVDLYVSDDGRVCA